MISRRGLIGGGVAAGVIGAAGAGWAGLGKYVRARDEFSWSPRGEQAAGEVTIITLQMRSQVWRGIPWDHAVQVFMPRKVTHPKSALMLVTGGSPGPTTTLLLSTIAPRLEAPAVVLYDIPNQPLLEGKREDDLIAHTFQEYLKSGDETWPLLLPMTKSAVRAMDAVQELSRTWGRPVEEFVITGASKRGWTTFLAAACDRRVRAIAPMVFDNLNFRRQLPRQLELWGEYSEQIQDYTRRGLQQQLDTERGRQLVEMVDPWHYRERLTMPKLLIHGANDRYWATDATRRYWDDLRGEKYLLAIPNAGHGLEDRTRLLNSLTAFFHSVAADERLPRLTARTERRGEEVRVRCSSSSEPREARLWTARAPGLDFRPQRWSAAPMEKRGRDFVAHVPAPGSTGGLALLCEAEYERSGRTFTLTTPPEVLGTRARV